MVLFFIFKKNIAKKKKFLYTEYRYKSFRAVAHHFP